jgi:hypothetical protein
MPALLKFRHDLLRHVSRHFIIMREFLTVDTAALGHGTECCGIMIEFFQRNGRFDDLMRSIRVHTDDLAAAAGEITHHIAHMIVRDGHFHFADRFQGGSAWPL